MCVYFLRLSKIQDLAPFQFMSLNLNWIYHTPQDVWIGMTIKGMFKQSINNYIMTFFCSTLYLTSVSLFIYFTYFFKPNLIFSSSKKDLHFFIYIFFSIQHHNFHIKYIIFLKLTIFIYYVYINIWSIFFHHYNIII